MIIMCTLLTLWMSAHQLCDRAVCRPTPMASFLANTKLVNKKGKPCALDPSLPTYVYFGAVW